jgi:hypothetical protein
MNVTTLSSIWQNNKQYIILGTTGILLIIVSLLLNFVKFGLLLVGTCIVVYTIVSVVRKVSSRKNGDLI